MDLELFKFADREAKRRYLVTLIKYFYSSQKMIPQIKDLKIINISIELVESLFESFEELLSWAGMPKSFRNFKMSDEELKDYLNSIKIVITNECWHTLKYTTATGRSKILYKGKKLYLYRLSYILFKGEIPAGKIIMHKCDDPSCFNPEHLKIGTYKDNIQDCISKGRKKNTKPTFKKHKITDPYNYIELLEFIKSRRTITEKNEWLFVGYLAGGYVLIQIKGKTYLLHRLILANKLDKNMKK